MRRFPLRTLLLMILALAAFLRLWCATHPPDTAAPAPTSTITEVDLVPARPFDAGAATDLTRSDAGR